MATAPATPPSAPPARQKSPKYPNISLADAIDRVRRVFEADRTAPLDREVVARHMGYSGISGAADKTIGSIMQYGLMERVGKGEIKVSDRALDILHPDTPKQRHDALRAAAYAPPVFKGILERFPEAVPSVDALRSYLVRLQFFDIAIPSIISAYSETNQFLDRELASGSGGRRIDPAKQSDTDEEDENGDDNGLLPPPPPPPPLPRKDRTMAQDERVLTKGMLSKASTYEIIVSGKIGPKEIDTLIRKLEIDKELLADSDDDTTED